MKHIIYIPGLGDGYDPIRKLGLRLWRRKDVKVTHIAMHWLDQNETMEQKIERVQTAVNKYPDAETIVVGESAGGAMAIVVADKFAHDISEVVTVCGMNFGVANVSPHLYKKNPAFRSVMERADEIHDRLAQQAKDRMFILYSSRDFTVRPRNTLVRGVASKDIGYVGHMTAILAVLFWRFPLITSRG